MFNIIKRLNDNGELVSWTCQCDYATAIEITRKVWSPFEDTDIRRSDEYYLQELTHRLQEFRTLYQLGELEVCSYCGDPSQGLVQPLPQSIREELHCFEVEQEVYAERSPIRPSVASQLKKEYLQCVLEVFTRKLGEKGIDIEGLEIPLDEVLVEAQCLQNQKRHSRIAEAIQKVSQYFN